MSKTEMTNQANKLVVLALLLTDFIWLRSSWGKLTSGTFVSTMADTLTKFASKNPYPFMKDFIEGVAKPNANLFGSLTMYGEALVAVSLLVSGLALLTKSGGKNIVWLAAFGLLGGIWLNAIFYFAAGWTGSSTESLNLYMAGIELILLAYVLKLSGR